MLAKRLLKPDTKAELMVTVKDESTNTGEYTPRNNELREYCHDDLKIYTAIKMDV